MRPAGAERRGAALVVLAIVSIQCGAGLAIGLFDRVGPAGAVLLRTAFAALVLLLFVGRDLGARHDPRLRRDAFVFGLILAGMNLSFYEAIDRLPLGTAVTLEFIGPLGVAVAGTRRRSDLLWVALAAGGVILLSGGIEGESELLGVGLVLIAAGFWAAYIVLNSRIGSRHEGLAPLAFALCFSALFLLPMGLVGGGTDLLMPSVLVAGLAIGVLSSALPYAFELQALRTLPSATFGVLMSLEPAVAALVGLLALSQALSGAEIVAMAMVVAASVGALRSAGLSRPID